MLLIVVLEKTLRVPSTAWRSNQSIVKEISPKYSLKGLMLRLKLQYFGHLMRRTDSLERPWCWERLKVGGEGTTEYEMVGWHHRLNEHEFEQSPGVGDGQGSLACCSPWGHKESDMTERLNWTELIWRANSLEKTLMSGKTEGKRRKGWQRVRGLDCITDSILDVSLSKPWDIVKDRDVWYCSPWGCREPDTI